MTVIKDTSSEHQQTEFRFIPHGWGVKRISEFTSIITGGTPNTLCAEYWGGDIRWMNSGELNFKFIDDVKGRITAEGLKNSSTHLIPEGCILIGLAGQGKTRGTAAFNRVPLCTNQSIAAILPSENHDSLYLYYVIDSKYEYLRLLSSGDGGRGGLNKNLLSSLLVLLPNDKSEQKAIAQALNDVDKLIIALDKKIEKKRLIKQGAMQQLLTGKIRLVGFNDPWIEKTLDDILNYEQPQKYLVYSTKYVDYGIPVLTAGKTLILGYTHELWGIYEKLPVIIFDDFTTSSKYITYPFKVKSSAMKMLNLKSNEYNLRLIYELIQLIDFQLTDHQRYWISKYSKLIIKLPQNYDEQIAIATILSDIDKEIADLEARRDKYRLIKKGMMQKLLTGQIRLVKPQTKSLAEVRRIPVAAHIIAGHIVNSLYGSKGWGRTKLQKSMHLIGYYCQLDFGNDYIQNTAGPDDQILMDYIDAKFRQYRHVRIVKQKDSQGRWRYDYRPNEGWIEEVEIAFENYPPDIQDKINALLAKIKSMDLGRAEIISTLYAVWNNRIIKNEPIIDTLLLEDFYAWSKHKLNFNRELVLNGLKYMRKEGIVPTGWGKYIDKKE
mgnify:CR=1 FL=1